MNLFVLSWLLVNLLPAIVWESSSSRSIPLQPPSWILLLVLAHLIPLVILEGILYSSLLEFAGRSVTKVQRWLRSSLTLCIFLLGIAYSIGAWISRGRTNSFPQAYDLNLLEFVTDSRTIALYIAPLDLALIAIGFALASAFVLRLITRRRASPSPISLHLVVLNVALLIGAFLTSRYFATIEERGTSSRLLAHHTTPQGTVLGWLLYPSLLQTYTKVPLQLIPVEEALTPTSTTPPFNVLVIAVEALRYDTLDATLDGEPVAPTIRTLATRGTSFARAYAQATDTDYSLSTILTGLYPLKFPSRDLGRDLSYPNQTLPALFSSQGFRTGYFTVFDWKTMMRKWHDHGFDYISDPTVDGGAAKFERDQNAKREDRGLPPLSSFQSISLLDELNFSRFQNWIETNKTPFFSLVYLYATHYPYSNPEDSDESIHRRSYYFPEEEAEIQRQRYYRAVRRADQTVSKYVDLVRNLNSSLPTIIVVTGDHGEEFYEHGGYLHVGKLHDEVMHVPLVALNLPPHCRPNTEMLVGHVDLAPTLAALLGLPQFPGYHGIDFCDKSDPNRVLFASSQAFAQEDAVLYKDWKCVRPIDGTPTRCFNLTQDPHETTPHQPLSDEIYASLQLQLERYRNKLLSYFSITPDDRNRFYPPVPINSYREP